MSTQTQKAAWVTPTLEELRMADTAAGRLPGMEAVAQPNRSPS